MQKGSETEKTSYSWKGYYAKEPFDFRLALLRIIRNIPKLLLVIFLGTAVLFGAYYLKNVVFTGPDMYEALTVYKIDYMGEEWFEHSVYINEHTWNDLSDTKELKKYIQSHLEGEERDLDAMIAKYQITFSSKVEADLRIPKIRVISTDPQISLTVAKAMEKAMVENLKEIFINDVDRVMVLDEALDTTLVEGDVRLVRALILSFVIAGFLTVVLFLLEEWGSDSIWVTPTLYKRYGLKVVQTSEKLSAMANDSYLFKDLNKVAVCPLTEEVDGEKVKEKLSKHKLLTGQWVVCPALSSGKEVYEKLKAVDGVLLVVKAGPHAGRKLEFALSQFAQQDIAVTAVLLEGVDLWMENLYQI